MAVALAGVIVLLAGGWAVLWKEPPFVHDVSTRELRVPPLNMEEYSGVAGEHARPYVLEVGPVLVFGIEHTRDPEDPQIALLRERWAAFEPTVALVEGRLGKLLPGVMDPVRVMGEGGAVYALARQAGINTWTWEPPREAEVAMMLRDHPAERVALFYVLRPYFGQMRFGRPADPEGFVAEYLRERTSWQGLEGTLTSVDDIDRIWRRDFAGLPDWRDTSDEYGWPGYLGELADRSNAIRDEHLVNLILDLVERGERVFVVAGSSHPVKIERTLRAEL